MKRVWSILLIIFLPSLCLADTAAKKSLVDLNGDGVKEVAVKGPPGGNSGSYFLKMFSGKDKKMILKVGMSGDTADDYKVVGKQIVVWRGNWNSGSKWSPHIYDLQWYQWDGNSKKLIIIREAFTKKAYSYKAANSILPQIAVNPKRSVFFSKKATFVQDAIELAHRKYGTEMKAINIQEFLDTEELSPGCVHCFQFSLCSKKRSMLVDAILFRDGHYELNYTI